MISQPLLQSYADAMIHAADCINSVRPDFVVAPMLGSVPFIDAMTIVSKDFDPTKVVYMPASSKIEGVNEVIFRWYSNFLNEVVASPREFPRVIGIDEVVSGGSVVRCLKNIDRAIERKRQDICQRLVSSAHAKDVSVSLDALNTLDLLTENVHAVDFATMRQRITEGTYAQDPALARRDSAFFVRLAKETLTHKLAYRTIGIEDSKGIGKRAPIYEELKQKGRVNPVRVQSIITMDDPRYCPVQFEEAHPSQSEGYNRFSPRVKEFKVTPEYVNFLRSLASYVGKDPEQVYPVNMGPILASSRFLGNL